MTTEDIARSSRKKAAEPSEEEIAAFIRGHSAIGPIAFATRQLLRRQLMIMWYGTVNWYRTHSIWERLAYATVYLSLPVGAAMKLGWSRSTILGILALVAFQGRKAWVDYSPKNMQLVRRNYVERKLRFKTLIEDSFVRDHMTPHEVQRFREDALKLIAAYVRDYRHDTGGRKIFASLLVRDGDEIVVIARDQPLRHPGARYPKAQMLAGRVFDTGEPHITGDVQADFPEGAHDRSYRSILALPVFYESKVAGVVSIDSQARYHFDEEGDALFDYLSPYVTMLSWTVSTEHASQYLMLMARAIEEELGGC